MTNFYKIKNRKGNENPVSDNYIFNITKVKNSIDIWRCVKMSCRVLGHINQEYRFILHKTHSHSNEKTKILKKLLSVIINESTDTGRPALEVITQNTYALDSDIVTIYTHINIWQTE
ncbi:hypothetical protein DMUE_1323 [Dictyocoela muelleri]|nr:hypothetical protein DMUE_1323 [Dictyocoela muelleri]